MRLRIISRKQNPLLKREEVIFQVDHGEEGETTSRSEIRRELADVLKSKLELVFVERAETGTGTMTAKGEANVYATVDQAKLIEREHIIQRNQLKEPAEVESVEKPAEVESPASRAPPEQVNEDLESKQAEAEKPKPDESKVEKHQQEESSEIETEGKLE